VSDVIPFKRPEIAVDPGGTDETVAHLSGTAQCVSCCHRWVAVVPVSTVELECPECKLNTGRMRNLCVPGSEDALIWKCNCGCDLFMVVKDAGYMCVRCGEYQRGF